MKSKLVVALAGNPNSGKTTIFNNLTGARQHVGNYPGVTVERKEGVCRHGGHDLRIVDLPGMYSLTARSMEEAVAGNFLMDEKPDVVVCVIDSSNLERNLYLAVQLAEMGLPLVLAFNMSDTAKARGHRFDLEKFSGHFAAPVVQTVGHRKAGMRELLDAIVEVGEALGRDRPAVTVAYGRDLEAEISRISALVKRGGALPGYVPRWTAIRLVENDRVVRSRITDRVLLDLADESRKRIEMAAGGPPETAVAAARYATIAEICAEAFTAGEERRITISDRIDSVLAGRLLGLPVFFGLMYLIFQLTFTLGDPLMGWIEELFGALGGVVSAWWPKGSESPLRSLLVDGIIGGVGGVVVFLPNILLLFLAIAILEASGYMARVAFIMDRFMHRIGLHGKSFIPMLIGFGCSVPAIMATRTLENRRDRLATMMVVPLMSCGARLPIYALIIPAFFAEKLHAPMLWLIYMIGIALAVVSAKLLRVTVLRGESVPFVMELPSYRLPTTRGVLIHMWERGWLYLKKAGTIILGISVILWAMTGYPKKDRFDHDYESELAGARTAFLDKALGIDGRLGAGGSLARAVKIELDTTAEQEGFYEHEDGYERAERRKEVILAELVSGPGGAALKKFLEMREQVMAVRSEFDLIVEDGGLPEGTDAYADAEWARDEQLGVLRAADGRTYAATVEFLDDVETPYREAVAEIGNRMSAESLAHSLAGRTGRFLEPVLAPMGFDWKVGTALIGAFAAKEVFVAQMGIVYSVGEVDEESSTLRERLRARYSPLTAFCIMLFCLVSAPCMATIAVTRRESGSWRWAFFQLAGLTVLAWVLTVLVFQVGVRLGIGVA